MLLCNSLKIKPTGGNAFVDVPLDYWANPFVNAVSGFVTRYTYNGQYYFRPDIPICREDVAVALVKAKGLDLQAADESILQAMFTDYESISPNMTKYVALAVQNKLMSGYPDQTFRAQDSLTRAEIATLMDRVRQLGSYNKVTTDSTQPGTVPVQQPTQPAQPQVPTQPQTPVTQQPTNPQQVELPQIPYKLNVKLYRDYPSVCDATYRDDAPAYCYQLIGVILTLGETAVKDHLYGLKVLDVNGNDDGTVTVGKYVGYLPPTSFGVGFTKLSNESGYYKMMDGEGYWAVTDKRPEKVKYEVYDLTDSSVKPVTVDGGFSQ
ncbi:MAG: S-layer homology domain-containing protein [Mobilitalea sp.]